MNTKVTKLAKEPLVWVGAALLCVPLLASSSLNHLSEALTFDRGSRSVASSFDPDAARDVTIDSAGRNLVLDRTRDRSEPIPDDWRQDADASMSSPLPPFPPSKDDSTDDVAEFGSFESSLVSLPPSLPKVAMADPGSLLEMAEIYQDDADEDQDSAPEKSRDTAADESSGDADEEGFDFLFGDEPDRKEPEEDSSTDMKKSVGDATVKDSQSSKLSAKESDSSDSESEDWLFSDNDSNNKYKPEPIEPPKMSGTDFSEFGQQPDGGSVWAPESISSPNVHGQPLTNPQALRPQNVQTQSPDSGYYVELNAGPDWWTPYCQQSFWNSVPARQTGLDAIVFAAMQNSPYVKLLNTEPQIAQTTITEADAIHDWSAFVETSWNDTDRPVVSLLDTGTAGGRFVQQQLLFEAGVQKNLATGGHLRVGHAWQRTDNNSALLSPADQATAQILLDYRQPLLRGAGRHINSSQVMLAQLNFESTQNNSQALIQQFLVDVVAEYWELHFARGVLMQKLRSVERAEQLMAELASVSKSKSHSRDLARIQAVAVSRRTGLIRAKNEVAMRQEKLLNLTYGASMPDSSLLEIVPTEAPGTFMVPHDLAFVTEMAVQNRSEVKVALGAIRASAIRQNLALNDLKPRLDAIVSTFLSGVDVNKDVGGAFNDSVSYNPSYAVGVSFEMPIGRRSANARVARQQLEYQRLQYQLEQTLGNVRLDARLALRNVSSIASELENQKLAVAQAAKELQLATEEAAAGVSNSASNLSFLIDDLMRSQEGLAIAESRLLRSQTDLSVALVQLKRATGQLLQTAPVPQISDFTVQQAGFEQPAKGAIPWPTPADESQQKATDLWEAPIPQ